MKKAANGKSRSGLCIFLVVVMIVELFITAFKYPGFLRRGDDKNNTEVGSLVPEPAGKAVTESGIMPKEGGSISLAGVTVSTTGENLSGDEKVTVTDYGVTSEGESQIRLYDISMGEHRQFEVPVEVTIKVELDDDEDAVLVHHIEETDTWMPLISEINREEGTVTAYYSSFSESKLITQKKDLHKSLYVIKKSTNKKGEPSTQHASYEVSNYYWSILKELDPAHLSDEAIRFVADPSLYANEFERYSDNYERDKAAAFNETSAAFTVLGPVLDITSQIPPSIQNYKFDFSEPVGKSLGFITLAMTTYQAYQEFKQAGGDLNALPAPAVNAYKNLFTGSGTFYSFLSGYGSIGFSIAFVGVTLVAFELDNTIKNAKLAMSARTADVFDAYFTKVAPFDKNEWYRAFKDAYYNSNNDPNVAMSKISDKINKTVEGFWTDIYNEENIDVLVAATEADTKNLFTKNNIYFYNVTEEEKAALNAQMKQELWKRCKKETMPMVNRFLMERLQDSIYGKLSVFTEPFNNYMDFEIMETVPDIMDNAESVARFAGCTLAFGRDGKPVADWDTISIPEDMIDGWKTEYDCTVIGYLQAGCPDTLYVYENQEDVFSGKAPIYERHIDPDITGKETTGIDLTEYKEEPVGDVSAFLGKWYHPEYNWSIKLSGDSDTIRYYPDADGLGESDWIEYKCTLDTSGKTLTLEGKNATGINLPNFYLTSESDVRQTNLVFTLSEDGQSVKFTNGTDYMELVR